MIGYYCIFYEKTGVFVKILDFLVKICDILSKLSIFWVKNAKFKHNYRFFGVSLRYLNKIPVQTKEL